ncbi:MAG: subclass B1 metallo-beta-lactamase [Treponema sp.]|nr:subclass B1 metallo-beta-lactamase [Treponema sp.]
MIKSIDREIKESIIGKIKCKSIEELQESEHPDLIGYWQGDNCKNLCVMSNKFDELYRTKKEDLRITYYDDIIDCIHKINAAFHWKYNNSNLSEDNKRKCLGYISYTQIHINRLQQQRNQLQCEEQQRQYEKQQRQYRFTLRVEALAIVLAIVIAAISFILTHYSNIDTKIANALFDKKINHLHSKIDTLYSFFKESDNKYQKTQSITYKSDALTIIKISEFVYKHISHLTTKNFGIVPCNGMIVISNGEAVIFDTPVDDKSAAELVDWLTKSRKLNIVAIIPTHYHADNLGGLNEFHRRDIASYALNKTIGITKERGLTTIPQNGFDERLELSVGGKEVLAQFFGGGHTVDNIIGYFPHDEIMFGGCLITNVGAQKGNFAEADLAEWSNTVKRIRTEFPNVRKVITGHGTIGTIADLDYTIELFKQ